MLILQSTYAQQNTVSSGGNASGSGGQVSYTIGQLDYINSTSAYGSFNQGVQQTYEFFAAVDELSWSVEISVFPNPFSEIVNIIGTPQGEKFTWKLFDANRKILLEGFISSKNTLIDLRELEPAIYYLQVNELGIQHYNFKLIKTSK